MGLFREFSSAMLLLVILTDFAMSAMLPVDWDEVPQNTTAIVGQSATFRCEPTKLSSNDNSIVWKFRSPENLEKGGDDVVAGKKYVISERGTKLTVQHVAKTDQGFYWCCMSKDGRSSNSTQGFLAVIPKPSFRLEPSNQTVAEGLNVTLKCRLQNFDAKYCNVTWFRNQHPVKNINSPGQLDHQNEFIVQGDTDSGEYDLTIINISRETTGYFDCRLHCDGRRIEKSRTAKVDVLFPPKRRYPKCKSSRALKSYYRPDWHLETQCRAVGGHGPIYWKWSKRGRTTEEIFHDENPHGEKLTKWKWTLTAKDDGSYIVCSMEGPAILTRRECTIGPITVYHGPTVSLAADDLTATVGSNVTFNCSICANPNVSADDIVWLVNGITVPEPEKYEIRHRSGGSELTIYNVTEMDDNVIFTCKVRNKTNARAFAKLKVIRSESFTPVYISTNSTQLVHHDVIGTATQPTRTKVKTRSLADYAIPFIAIGLVTVVIIVLIIILVLSVRYRQNRKKRAARKSNELHVSYESFVDPHLYLTNVETHYDELSKIGVTSKTRETCSHDSVSRSIKSDAPFKPMVAESLPFKRADCQDAPDITKDTTDVTYAVVRKSKPPGIKSPDDEMPSLEEDSDPNTTDVTYAVVRKRKPLPGTKAPDDNKPSLEEDPNTASDKVNDDVEVRKCRNVEGLLYADLCFENSCTDSVRGDLSESVTYAEVRFPERSSSAQ